jgi:kumamolisin
MSNYVRLVGPKARVPDPAAVARDVNPNEEVEITVILRRDPYHRMILNREAAFASGDRRLRERSYVQHAEFADQYGANPEDIAKIEAFAHEHGLTVVDINKASRSVKLRGTLAQLLSAFPVEGLAQYISGSRTFRAHTGAVSVPLELSGIVTAIFGFDTRTAARPRSELGSATPRPKTFKVPQLTSLYNFPAQLTGIGQCIGIIALNDVTNGKASGGGFRQSDLDAYFQSLGLPVPKVETTTVDGGANLPGPAPGYDDEITLDIEVAGAAAPGASLIVYFAPNTDKGFIDVVNAAIHDSVNKPSIISLSWGAQEDSDVQLSNALNEALQDAVQLGVTVCVAAGDLGSADQIPPEMDGQPHVDAPASSPFVLACGGTKLSVDGDTIIGETAWNDGLRNPWGTGAGGGGFSKLFDRPTYQSAIQPAETGRGVPDIACHSSTAAGYQLFINGKQVIMGGTSAATPLIAGLFARINQHLAQSGLPHVGFVNPLLYKLPSSFRDITGGNNDLSGQLGIYSAGPGWDACTGIGVPDGTKLLDALNRSTW